MNYLAHLYLAEDSPESLVGNLLADFIRGNELSQYSDPIRKGIALHRKVDAFTDSHPVVLEGKRLVSPANRRYAGVLLDVFYDHFLARHWTDYASEPLDRFTRRIYALLEGYDGVLPESFRRMAARMAAEDWLASYAEPSGIDGTLKRIAARLPRETGLGSAVEELASHYEGFECGFRTFFPQLAAYAATLRGEPA
jgi:acyl carrier protein phosphodiesterase